MLPKPYLICWLAIPLLLLIGFVYHATPLNIQLYSTYYVAGVSQFVLIGSIVLLLVGFGYWLLNEQGKTPNTFLTILHLVLTIGVLCMVLPVSDADDKSVSIWLFWAVLIFLPVQGVFAFYLLVSLLRR